MIDAPGSDRILTIPNLVSFVRLVGVGVFWWALTGLDDVRLGAVLIFAIGWTDWVDGYLARRLNQVSRLGKALDPIADRIMIFSAVVGGLIVDVVPVWIGWPLIVREILMAVVTLVVYVRGAGTLAVRYLGKLSTFLLYGAIPSFYLAATGVAPGLFEVIAWIMGGTGLVLYGYVAFLYLGDARAALARLESAADAEET